MKNLIQTITDALIMAKRNLTHYKRLPKLIIFSTIQPIMFVLLFVFVFGGAIQTGVDYVQYLLPGILVQTIIFGSIMTGVALSQDFSRGIIDRFRSLPMARSAVLAGRTIADVIRNIFVALLIITAGLIVGFRIEHGVLPFITAISFAILFGFVFSWISAFIGVSVKDPETAQTAGFVWVFPLVFASSIFVPVETMPDWLQVFAKHSPITITVNIVRGLTLGLEWKEYVFQYFAWVLGLLAIFMPLAIWRYKKQ